MMLGEISTGESWILGCTIVMALASVAAVVIAVVALRTRSSTEISTQPLIIAMQKEFATTHEFDAHVVSNKGDHDSIFAKIGGVERGARSTTDQQVEVVRRDLVQVSNQVAGLQVETKMQSTQLNRMEKIISDMPGRIVADIVNSKKL